MAGRDKRSFCLGMALRLMQKSLPLSPVQKEPVAYLYNGVRLPDINKVWTDKETYPYGAIVNPVIDLSQIRFIASKYKIEALSNEAVGFYIGHYVSYLYENGEWKKLGDGVTICQPFWCSDNIYYDSVSGGDLAGTLYLAASDPIPVYE